MKNRDILVRAADLAAPLAAGSLIVLLAGCGQQPVNSEAKVADAADVADTAPAPAESVDRVVEVVSLPAVPAAAAGDDVAPLAEVAAVEEVIEHDAAVTRVRHGDGWAWLRDGQIIRTASTDGRRVSYYRRGASTPYLVQDEDRTFAYRNGAVSREYDRDGRARAPGEDDRRRGRDLAQAAEREHDRAQEAAREAARTSKPNRPAGRQDAAATTPRRTTPDANREDRDASGSSRGAGDRTEAAPGNGAPPNTSAGSARTRNPRQTDADQERERPASP